MPLSSPFSTHFCLYLRSIYLSLLPSSPVTPFPDVVAVPISSLLLAAQILLTSLAMKGIVALLCEAKSSAKDREKERQRERRIEPRLPRWFFASERASSKRRSRSFSRDGSSLKVYHPSAARDAHLWPFAALFMSDTRDGGRFYI